MASSKCVVQNGVHFFLGPHNTKVNSLFISKEILKAEISKIGPPYDMDFVEL